jgi:hypothetical protein
LCFVLKTACRSLMFVIKEKIVTNSLSVTTKVVSSNQVHGEVYSIQHYVIKFVSDLWQVSGYLWVLQFSPSIKLTDNWNIVESGRSLIGIPNWNSHLSHEIIWTCSILVVGISQNTDYNIFHLLWNRWWSCNILTRKPQIFRKHGCSNLSVKYHKL